MLSMQQGKTEGDHLLDPPQGRGPPRQVKIKVHQVIQLIQIQLKGRIREGVEKRVLFGVIHIKNR